MEAFNCYLSQKIFGNLDFWNKCHYNKFKQKPLTIVGFSYKQTIMSNGFQIHLFNSIVGEKLHILNNAWKNIENDKTSKMF